MQYKKQKKAIKKEAVVAQSLFLVNLLLLPLLAFIMQLVLYKKRIQGKGINYLHQHRAIQLSVVAGVLLLAIPGIIIWRMENIEASIMVFILYFIIVHVGFVLLGMINLSRAIAGKAPVF